MFPRRVLCLACLFLAFGLPSLLQAQMEPTTAATRQKPPTEAPRQDLDREILSQFMSANEAMARVGAVLTRTAGTPSGDEASSLRAALRNAMDQLGSLAHSTGFDLEEPRV